MTIGAAIIGEIVAAAEADPDLAARLRGLLGGTQPGPARLTIGEAAARARCGPRTIRDAVTRGDLPAVRCGRGGRITIAPADVDAWLRGRAVTPTPRATAPRSAADAAIDRALAGGRLRVVGGGR